LAKNSYCGNPQQKGREGELSLAAFVQIYKKAV